LGDSMAPLVYKAEKYLQLQGSVRTLSGKPVSEESIVLADAAGQGPEVKAKTDHTGRFAFSNLDFTDTMHFVLTPGKISSRIVLSDYPTPLVVDEDTVGLLPDVNGIMPAYLNVFAQDLAMKKAMRGKLLKPVTVKAARLNDYFTRGLAGAGTADQVLHGSDLHGGGFLSDQLNGLLRGVIFVKGSPILSMDLSEATMHHVDDAHKALQKVNPMLVVVDGVEMSYDMNGAGSYDINEISSSEIETVEVLKSANASIYGSNGAGGVLIITTKGFSHDVEVEDSPDPSKLHAAVIGFYKAREFYAPRYEGPVDTAKGRDLRTTVLWKPELLTGEAGAASFSFYNSDLEGTYRVVIEGIGENGMLARETYRYTVK
jgi:TonB-dependent SusC/RagA subfamily outer membrane receptor